MAIFFFICKYNYITVITNKKKLLFAHKNFKIGPFNENTLTFKTFFVLLLTKILSCLLRRHTYDVKYLIKAILNIDYRLLGTIKNRFS